MNQPSPHSSSSQSFVNELAQILVEQGDARGLLAVFDRYDASSIPFETIIALARVLGQSYIHCGPDVRGTYISDDAPTLDARAIQHLAVQSVLKDKPSFNTEAERIFDAQGSSASPEALRAVAFHAAAARDRVARVLDGIFSFGHLASPEKCLHHNPAPHVPLIASRDSSLSTLSSSVFFSGATAYNADGDQLVHFDPHFQPDKALLVPPVDSREMEQFLQKKLRHVPYLDVRGLGNHGREYDILRDGVALDFRFLRMLPGRESADFVAAAAHARHQQHHRENVRKTGFGNNFGRLKLFDSRFVRGESSTGNGDISFQKALERRYDFMDLPTFLELCSSPDYDNLRQNTHPVALNHVLPDGSFVQAMWGSDKLIFRSQNPENSSFRVFPVV